MFGISIIIILVVLLFLNFTYSMEEIEFFNSLCVGGKLKKKSNEELGTIIHIHSKQNIEIETLSGYITCDIHQLYKHWTHVLSSPRKRNYD